MVTSSNPTPVTRCGAVPAPSWRHCDMTHSMELDFTVSPPRLLVRYPKCSRGGVLAFDAGRLLEELGVRLRPADAQAEALREWIDRVYAPSEKTRAEALALLNALIAAYEERELSDKLQTALDIIYCMGNPDGTPTEAQVRDCFDAADKVIEVMRDDIRRVVEAYDAATLDFETDADRVALAEAIEALRKHLPPEGT